MHSAKQKVLALLLVAALACTFMLPAFAAGGEPAPQEPQYTYEPITDKAVMASTAKASSEETSDKAAGWNDSVAAWAFDGNTGKCWHSSYTPGNTAQTPITIEWDLAENQAPVLVGKLEYQTKTPKQDNGKWKSVEIIATVEGKEVSVFKGSINRDDNGHALIAFTTGPVNATHLKVIVNETDGDHSNGGNNDNKFAAAGEITVHKATLVEPQPEQPAEREALDKKVMAETAQANSAANSGSDGPAAWAFDNDTAKAWHSSYTAGDSAVEPFTIEWDLAENKAAVTVDRLVYQTKTPKQDNGKWKTIQVLATVDGKEIVAFEGDITRDETGMAVIDFTQPVNATHLKVVITATDGDHSNGGNNDNKYAAAGEITVYKALETKPEPEPEPQPDNSVAVVVAADGAETKFDTVAAAVAAAKADETVRLTKDSTAEAKIVLDKKLTLDLNGFTLTGATGELLHIMPTGDVQIVDSANKDVNGALIGLAGDALTAPAAMTIANQGKLTLNGVDVTGVKANSVDGCADVTAIFVDADAELVVTGDGVVTDVDAAGAVANYAANTILNFGTVTLNGHAAVAGVFAGSVTTEAVEGFNLGADVIATYGTLNIAEQATVLGVVAEASADADVRAVAASGALNLTGGTILTESTTAAVVLSDAALTMAEGAEGVVPVIENTRGSALAFAEGYENTQNITAGILTNPAVSGQFADLNQAVADGFTTETGNRVDAGWAPAEDGAYTKVVKGEKPQPAPFVWEFSNLSVAGNVGVNLYGTFNQDLTEHATVVISVPGHADVETAVNAAAETDYGRKFTAVVTVRQMTDPIQVKVMKDGQQVGETFTYTVQENAEKLIAESTKEAADFARAMLYQGAQMQLYKGYRTDALATSILPQAEQETLAAKAAAITAEQLAAYKPSVTGGAAGLKLHGVNLSLMDETTLRFFFNVEEGHTAAEYRFTVNGKAAEATLRSGKLCVEIPNISASGLSSVVTLEAAAADATLTVRYSPLSYARTVIADNTEALQGVARGLVLYNEAAKAYKVK